MPGPKGERCDTCYFWEPPKENAVIQADREFGVCRRNPITFYYASNTECSAFPKIKGIGWCGEWKSLVSDEIVETTRGWATDDKSALDNADSSG